MQQCQKGTYPRQFFVIPFKISLLARKDLSLHIFKIYLEGHLFKKLLKLLVIALLFSSLGQVVLQPGFIHRCLQIFLSVALSAYGTSDTALGVFRDFLHILVSVLSSRGTKREACGPLEMRLLTMNGGYWVRPKYGFSVIPRFWLLFLSLRFPGRKTVAELC